MNTYTFKRGKFGMYGVPMWAGETRAFKLIRLLKKQGIKKIRYYEGVLTPFYLSDHVKGRRLPDYGAIYPRHKGGHFVPKFMLDKMRHPSSSLGKAPHQFIVSWEN